VYCSVRIDSLQDDFPATPLEILREGRGGGGLEGEVVAGCWLRDQGAGVGDQVWKIIHKGIAKAREGEIA
jgi:hypothetical protein